MSRLDRNVLNLIDPLFVACESGDVDSLKMHLQSSEFDVHRFYDIYDMEEQTIMDVAIKNKQPIIIRTLLEHGWTLEDDVNGSLRAAVSSACVDTVTAIMKHLEEYRDLSNDFISLFLNIAAVGGHVEIVHLFLSRCPGIDITDALLDACERSKTDVVMFLLSYAKSHEFGDINDWFNEDMDTLMMFAVVSGSTAVIDALIAAGASIDYDDGYLFEYAAQKNCVSLVEQFLDINKNMTTDTLYKALEIAAESGYIDVIRAILRSGVDVAALPSNPLMEALQEGHVQAAKLLTDAGMRIEAEEGCKSPLMAAVLGGCTEIVANMINTGNKADVNSVFQDGDGYRTALSYASKPEIVRMLLDAMADVNPQGCASVIHEACTSFQPESVKMLLDAGAHPYEEIRSACSPYMRTLMFKCTEETADAKLAVVNLLLAAGVGTDRTSYCCASVAEDPCMERVLDVMLQYIPRLLECVDANGMTPLDYAVANKQLRKVQYLVAAGADVNYWKCTKNGKSLLFPLLSDPDACPRSRAILRVLLDAGVDLGGGDVTNKLTIAGQTVFMAAVSAEDRDDWVSATFIRDMAEAVLKRGLCGTVNVDAAV